MWSLGAVAIAFVLLFAPLALSRSVGESDSTLQFVQVVFRHGDRTTDEVTLYPNDPNINETYHPYGLGQLTNKGKTRQFRLGKVLRDRYSRLLGDQYTPDVLEALSSDFGRTKASLQLVLAGLFPPVGPLVWEQGLNWQPIPYSPLPRRDDQLFLGMLCPNYKKLYAEHVTSPRMAAEYAKNKEVMDYVSEKSGWNITTYAKLWRIYLCLETEEEFGLELPNWTKKVYPKPLEEFAVAAYKTFTATTGLKRLAAGNLLRRIVDNSRAKAGGDLRPRGRKIVLYSAHELNIAFVLLTLDVFKDHVPPYGCYILFELHKINGIHGLKIYYQDYSSREPKLLKLPACEEFCALDKFASLLEEYLPEDGECGTLPPGESPKFDF